MDVSYLWIVDPEDKKQGVMSRGPDSLRQNAARDPEPRLGCSSKGGALRPGSSSLLVPTWLVSQATVV
jgi:hypothetical protein